MFGGNLISMKSNENALVILSSSILSILHPKDFRILAQITVDINDFTIFGDQLITYTSPESLKYYSLIDGSLIQKQQLQGLPNILHFSDEYLIYIEKKTLKRFNLFENNEENTITQIPFETNLNTRIAYYQNQIAISHENHMLVIDTRRIKDIIERNLNYSIVLLAASDRTIAVSDQQGKIFILNWKLESIITPPQWHAHPINSLIFSYDGEQLFSAGKEGVLVQWYLQLHRKTLYPRQGNEIVAVNLLNGAAIVAVKGKNSIQQISLQGNGTSLKYQGIQNNTKNSKLIQYDSKSILINGVTGQLQIIDLRKNQFINSIDVTQRNYVSDADLTSSNVTRDQLDISNFAISQCGNHLICSVELISEKFNLSSLKFLQKNKDTNEFNVISSISKPHPRPIQGILSVQQKNQTPLFLTWSIDGSVRLWQYINAWNCIYHRIFSKILGISSLNGVINLLTNRFLISLDIIQDIIIDELPLIIEDEANYSISSNYVVKFYKGILTTWNIERKQKQYVQLNIKIVNKLTISEDKLFLIADNQTIMLFNISSISIIKAARSELDLRTIFAFPNTLTHDFYVVDVKNQYHQVFSLSFGKHRKSSVFTIEEEQQNPIQTSIQSKCDQKLINVIQSEKTIDHSKTFSVTFKAQKGRQFKEFDIKQYFIEQSHLTPNLGMIAKQFELYINEQDNQPKTISSDRDKLKNNNFQDDNSDEEANEKPLKNQIPEQVNKKDDKVYQDFLKLRNHFKTLEID